MSGESFNIKITGDANDSNLVLGSNSANISEIRAANITDLEGSNAYQGQYLALHDYH